MKRCAQRDDRYQQTRMAATAKTSHRDWRAGASIGIDTASARDDRHGDWPVPAFERARQLSESDRRNAIIRETPGHWQGDAAGAVLQTTSWVE